MKKRKKYANGGNIKTRLGELGSEGQTNLAGVGSSVISGTSNFYKQLLDAKYDPSVAKDELELAKMERKLQKRKTMASSISGATATGATTGATIGIGGGPFASLFGGAVGALAGAGTGIGAGAWLNSASGRRYKRKVSRLRQNIAKRNLQGQIIGANYIQNVKTGMQTGGKVKPLSKREEERLKSKTASAKNRRMQQVNNNVLYDYLNRDDLIPEGMTKSDFANLSIDVKRDLIPEEIYGIDKKYYFNPTGDTRISDYAVDPGYYTGLETPPDVPKVEKPLEYDIRYWAPGEEIDDPYLIKKLQEMNPGKFKGNQQYNIPISGSFKCGGKVKSMRKGGSVTEARKKPGGSNVGKYSGVKDFAGPSGGAPAGSFPINTRKRAKAALSYSRHAPSPEGIKRAVYRKYPSLKKNKKGMKDGGEVSIDKAKEILRDGTVHGKPLTDKQKKYFGWIAGGKAEGGMIEGAGGPKEDKISAKLNEGDFIIPADAPAEIVADLLDYLEIDQKADVKQGNIEKKVSDGEVLIPADMADKANDYLMSVGYENGLDDLAPMAEDQMNEMADGGWVELNKEYQKYVKQYRTNNPNSSDEEVRATYYNTLQDDTDKELFLKNKPVSQDWINKYAKPEKIEGRTANLDQTKNAVKDTNIDIEKRPANKTKNKPTGARSATRLGLSRAGNILKNLSTDPLTYAGMGVAAQTIGGAMQLNKLGARPDRKVDQDLSMLAVQTANEAMYGIDPRIKSKIEQQRNRDFSNITKAIVEYGGGSSGTTYNLMTDALRQKNLSDVELTQLDIAERERKKEINRNITMEIINQRNRIREGEIERYDEREQAYSDLFRSGIENAIGLGKYAAQRKFYKDIEENITNAPLIK